MEGSIRDSVKYLVKVKCFFFNNVYFFFYQLMYDCQLNNLVLYIYLWLEFIEYDIDIIFVCWKFFYIVYYCVDG